jgi:hypothetical protein
MTAGTVVLLCVLVFLYGILIGGTWTRRAPDKVWDTAQTIIFIVIAAVATIHLVIVGARQSDAIEKARDRLNCVGEQLDAIRVQAEMPACDVHWDAQNAP